MFLVVLINIFLLVPPNAGSSLFPPRNVFICPQESQEVQFVCNTTGEHVTWDINVNAVHHHVSFGYYSPKHWNKYNGFDGIEVTLEGASGNTLLTRTVVRIPSFNVLSHRLVVHCDYMARSLLVAGQKISSSYDHAKYCSYIFSIFMKLTCIIFIVIGLRYVCYCSKIKASL